MKICGGRIETRPIKGTRPRSADKREDLMLRRSALIKEIAALDDGFEAGGIDEAGYRKLRENKKAELIEVTRRLRF